MVLTNSKYTYICTLSILGIFMFIITHNTPMISDDLIYKYIVGSDYQPISNIKDIITSQINHYNTVNGRVVPHFLIQLFIYIGKDFFDLANALIFTLQLHLLTKITTTNKKDYIYTCIIAIIIITFILPGFKKCYLWMSGSFNYLWSSTFILYSHYILLKDNYLKCHLIRFLIGFLSGLTHEALIIGLLLGNMYYYYKHRVQLNSFRVVQLLGLLIGISFLLFSPGSITRFYNSSNSFSLTPYIITLFSFHKLRVFFILLFFVFLYYRDKNNLKINVVYLIALSISFIFILFTKYDSERARFCIEFYSLILTLIIINRTINIYIKRYIILFPLTIITILGYIIYLSHHNQLYTNSLIKKITQSSNNIIIFDDYSFNYLEKRFIYKFIFIDEQKFYPNFISTCEENILISKYFNRNDTLVFLPKSLLNNLEKYDKFHTENELPFYAKKIEPNEKIKAVKFTLIESDSLSLPFYIRLFAKKLERYTLQELPTNKYTTIDIKRNKYLFVTKEPIIDNRVKDIIYE